MWQGGQGGLVGGRLRAVHFGGPRGALHPSILESGSGSTLLTTFMSLISSSEKWAKKPTLQASEGFGGELRTDFTFMAGSAPGKTSVNRADVGPKPSELPPRRARGCE